jgi:hypothetical protein
MLPQSALECPCRPLVCWIKQRLQEQFTVNDASSDATLEPVQLRRRVIRELNRQGYHLRWRAFERNGEPEKEFVRARHARQRRERFLEELAFIERRGSELLGEFADGSQVAPAAIAPLLVAVRSESHEADLFRLASLLWSVPTSRGFGRRMRYLVRDQQNGKLMGLIALGDPVFNLAARDNSAGSRRDRHRCRTTSPARPKRLEAQVAH